MVQIVKDISKTSHKTYEWKVSFFLVGLGALMIPLLLYNLQKPTILPQDLEGTFQGILKTDNQELLVEIEMSIKEETDEIIQYQFTTSSNIPLTFKNEGICVFYRKKNSLLFLENALGIGIISKTQHQQTITIFIESKEKKWYIRKFQM